MRIDDWRYLFRSSLTFARKCSKQIGIWLCTKETDVEQFALHLRKQFPTIASGAHSWGCSRDSEGRAASHFLIISMDAFVHEGLLGALNSFYESSVTPSFYSASLLFIFVLSHLALIIFQLTCLLLLWRQFCSRLGIFLLSRKFEFAIGIVVIGFEYRPDRWDHHQQNIVGLDLDQDATARLLGNMETIAQWFVNGT